MTVAGRPTRPQAAQIAKRRADAIQLRLAGLDYLAIGKKLAADPLINSGKQAYPQGYGIERYEEGAAPPTDKKLAELAKSDVHRTMRIRRTEVREAADDLRDLQDERLNRLLAGMWQEAAQGDPRAVELALRIMERQARLHGLDAPTRTEVTGEGGAPLALGVVVEADRRAAIESVQSFRMDKEEAAAALELLASADEVIDEDVAAGYGADLTDDDEEESTGSEDAA